MMEIRMEEKRIVTLDRDGRVMHTVVHQAPSFWLRLLLRLAVAAVAVSIGLSFMLGYLTHWLAATHRI